MTISRHVRPLLTGVNWTRFLATQPTIKRNLQKPPVPPLNETLDRYLEYASVVAAGQKIHLHKTHEAVEKFRKTGEKYQKKLEELAESQRNWVNGFWLPEMYLRIRLPLPVNSNPAYIFPQRNFQDQQEMLKYTALMIRGITNYKDDIDKKRIPREISTGKDKVHMCMDQYERILACYRHPGIDEDIQLRRPKSDDGNEHIIVMSRNQAFVVFTRWCGDLLPYADVIYQLEQIVKRSRSRQEVAIPIGGVGAGDRQIAAEFWEKMKDVDVNANSLRWMQNALFVVCLDEDDDNNNIEKLSLVDRGMHLLVGNGSTRSGFNRWYDATIQLIVSSNGTSGLCIEHSVAEGIVIINMVESALAYVDENWKRKLLSKKERHFQPKSLSWHISNEGLQLIEKQRVIFDELASEMDLNVVEFDGFGKTFMKKCGVSPDGFVQLALQLAHFKLHKYLVSSYESASLRRFQLGRVDNIRANTHEALEWVTAMGSKHIPQEKKVELFRKAAAKQAKVTLENITGLGIDNHLCALSVLARGQPDDPEIFKDPMWNELMRFPLSTSQVTTSPLIRDTYLCYGAVVRDGYGCPYNIQNDYVVFAPSAFKSNSRTDVKAFSKSIVEAMSDMKTLLQQ